MSAERSIFCSALERSSATQRESYLDEACAGDPTARARVEALLQAAEEAEDFLDEGESPVAEAVGSRIGRYRLVERIGEGGFGVVYRAQQESPVRREVALKLTKLGMDTRAVVARFEVERQALAMMDHPNIAQVFDGGATESGRPYFVMELVGGRPITAYCDEQRLGVRDRLELFDQVCGAVHHAHQKGVIHRDLKPSNILVTRVGDRAVAKVIDFGIAKATGTALAGHSRLTRQPLFLGTPEYMSPEQLGGGDVDTRTDIYSLGALLFELLAGVPVVTAAEARARGFADRSQAGAAFEPPAPSQRYARLTFEQRSAVAAARRSALDRLAGELRGDLDRIVLTCLEREPARRYETTEDLARDLRRHLRHEPVLARRPTLAYRAGKFMRRHRTGVVAVAAVAIGLAAVSVYHAHRLAVERDRARAEARKAEKVSELLTELLTSTDPYRSPSPHGILEASAERVRREFARQPEVRLEILNAVGRVFLRRGEHDKARPVLTEALAAGRTLGRPDVRVAQTLSDLGILRRETGDAAGALPLLEEALELRRQLRGNDHNEVAISLVELSRARTLLEHLDRAAPLLREALAIRERVLGPEHREVAVSLGDLAVLHWQLGDLPAAESFFERSIAMHRRTVGDDHPNVGQSLANLAQLRFDQGRLDEADELLQGTLTIFRRSFGETHWRTAVALGHLGSVRLRQGRTDDAATLLDQALAHARASLGPDRPQVAGLMVERARVYLENGDASAAEALWRESLRLQRLAHVDDGWRIASTKSLLGRALLALGRTEEAGDLLAAASRVLPDVAGPRGREREATRSGLAALGRQP